MYHASKDDAHDHKYTRPAKTIPMTKVQEELTPLDLETAGASATTSTLELAALGQNVRLL